MIEIALESPPAGRREPVVGLRHPALEVLLAGDVSCLFQLAGMDAEVAIRRLQQPLEVVEAEMMVDGQGADDPQPHPLVDETVEVQSGLGSRIGYSHVRSLRLGAAVVMPERAAPSHRAASRSPRRTARAARRNRPPSGRPARRMAPAGPPCRAP